MDVSSPIQQRRNEMMKREEINVLCEKTTGLAYALGQEFGRKIPLDALGSEEPKAIDRQLLATVLEEYREREGNQYPSDPDSWRYNCESMYIVWSDGRIEKSDQVDYRCVGTTIDDWSGEEIYSGEIDWETEEICPIASHFVSNANIQHLILLESRSSRLDGQQKKIESITIKVFRPESGLDITTTSQEIMEIWESDGVHGLRDYIEDLSLGED